MLRGIKGFKGKLMIRNVRYWVYPATLFWHRQIVLNQIVPLNPLHPKIKIWILIWILIIFVAPIHFLQKQWGEVLKYQANSSCVIMSVILMTTLFYKGLILQGEIWCWSLDHNLGFIKFFMH